MAISSANGSSANGSSALAGTGADQAESQRLVNTQSSGGEVEQQIDLTFEPRPVSPSLQSDAPQHLWVCAGPFFETVLFVYCADRNLACRANESGEMFPIEIELMDPDGFSFNLVKLRASTRNPVAIELDPFMGGCKVESGFKHAHALVRIPKGFRVATRLIAREAACMLGSPVTLSSSNRAFFPVVLSRERFPMVVLMNRSASEASVRARLFCGKRSPETVWTLPPQGARVISIVSEFGDSIVLEPDEQLQAYLRIGVRGDYEASAQLIERVQGPKEGSLFLSIN